MFDKAFEKDVRKFFRKTDWTIGGSTKSSFTVSREIFFMHILLGPDIFERRYPIVEMVFAKKVYDIRQIPHAPNTLVVVRDRDTMPIYDRMTFDKVMVLHRDDLSQLDNLDVDLLTAETFDETIAWAVAFASTHGKICLALANNARKLGHAARALFWFEQAVIADPKDPINHHELAWGRFTAGDLDGAAEASAAALKLSPDTAALLTRASMIALRRGSVPEAFALAQQAVDSYDKTASDVHHLARLYLLKSEFDMAETMTRRAMSLDPVNQHFGKTLVEIETRRAAKQPAG